MMKTKKLCNHVKNCGAVKSVKDKTWFSAWSSYPNKIYFGNYAGNIKSIGNHHVWIEFKCNSTACGGSIIIKADDILSQVERF